MREKRVRTSSLSPALSSGVDATLSREPVAGYVKTAPAPASAASPASGTGITRQAYGPAWPLATDEAPLAGPASAPGPEKASAPSPASGTGIKKKIIAPAWRLATEEVPPAGPVHVAWLGVMKYLPKTTTFKKVLGLMNENKMCAACRELYAYEAVKDKDCSEAPLLMFPTGHFMVVKEIRRGAFEIMFKGCPATDSPQTEDSIGPSAAAQNPVPPSQSQPSPQQGGAVEEPN